MAKGNYIPKEEMKMEEANKIIEETLDSTGFEVTEMLPENPGVGKKLAIAGGVGFVAGVVVSKVAKPVAKWVRSKFQKKVSNDDFEVVEDDFFEDEAETEKTE